ncbi:hypothetical protein KCU77_g24412, partial [Aureobasidium melanogenum]
MHPHHVVQQGRGQPNGHVALQPPHPAKPASHYLQQANEGIWLQLGSVSEMMGEYDSATQAYERALSFNNHSVQAMLAISCILRSKDQFPAAVEYLKQ